MKPRLRKTKYTRVKLLLEDYLAFSRIRVLGLELGLGLVFVSFMGKLQIRSEPFFLGNLYLVNTVHGPK